MPSEFAIVATEDNTSVTIYPSTKINQQQNLDPITFALGANQVYFAQAALEQSNDITGTEVIANKPVGVFSGNKRTSVPSTIGNFRDLLVEQMIPVKCWQQKFFVTPFPDVAPEVIYHSIVRIVGGFDRTEITLTSLNGTETKTLASGQFLEIEVTDPLTIESSLPVLVAHYEHSVGETTSGAPGTFGFGDPFMILIPSPEQFQSLYTFSSISHEEFTKHYVTAFVPADRQGLLLVDDRPAGNPVQSGEVPGSDYLWYTYQVAAGPHTARLDVGLDEDEEDFGLLVYGYGQATSYGYPAGMKLPEAPSEVKEKREMLAEAAFSILPQPVYKDQGMLQLRLPVSAELTLDLYDAEGRRVKALQQNVRVPEGESQLHLDLSEIPSGSYHCVVTTGTEVIKEIPVIINH